MLGKRLQSNSPVSVIVPPNALPCPPIYLVSELTTNEAPTALGKKRCGDVIVLSTQYIKSRCLQTAPIPARSAICVTGLAIVSTKTRRVFSLIAASTLLTAVASTKLTSMPSVCSVPKKLFVLPNRFSPAADSSRRCRLFFFRFVLNY